MNSDVELTFGFSFSILDTETPVFAEMVWKVSPALTVQNACVGTVSAVEATVVADDEPCSRPARMRITAIVTASRKAAGAAYRRHSGCAATYQPEAAQISCFNRAASAPAAVR